MKRYLEIEKIVYQELEKNCFGNKKKTKAIVIYLAFQPYVLPIVSMYN